MNIRSVGFAAQIRPSEGKWGILSVLSQILIENLEGSIFFRTFAHYLFCLC